MCVHVHCAILWWRFYIEVNMTVKNIANWHTFCSLLANIVVIECLCCNQITASRESNHFEIFSTSHSIFYTFISRFMLISPSTYKIEWDFSISSIRKIGLSKNNCEFMNNLIGIYFETNDFDLKKMRNSRVRT